MEKENTTMKQVYLHFKEIELGFLTQQEKGFVWVPNPENIQYFMMRYDGASDLFFLNKTEPALHPSIPYHFIDFVESSSRPDLAQKAGIVESDSDFDRLCKMATLSYADDEFVIKRGN